VGIDTIDEHHRYLLQLIAKLEYSVVNAEGIFAVNRAMNALYCYAVAVAVAVDSALSGRAGVEANSLTRCILSSRSSFSTQSILPQILRGDACLLVCWLVILLSGLLVTIAANDSHW